MKVPNMNKEFFLRNYNYHFRFANIKRKIRDYQLNAEKLQEVMETIYKPIKIKGVLREKGKKIFEHEGIFLTMISDVIEGPTKIRKKYYMLSKKEQIKYLLLLEIISETTQYCADLAAIMISLRDFNKNKLSIVNITDIINRRLNLSNKITIHHFLVNDIQAFLKFNNTNQFGIEINYNKSQKDKNRIFIN